MDLKPSEERRQITPYWRLTLIFGLGFLIAITGFGAGMLTERDLLDGSAAQSNSASATSEFTRFNEVKNLIEDEFYGAPADPTAAAGFEQSLEYGAIQGMMGALDDYSTFLVPAQQSAVRDQLNGEYQGIGVWVDFPNGRLTIVSAMPGSPAEEAGLKAGDVIETVDGHSLVNTSAEDALNLVRGPEGSKVRLSIRRTGNPDAFELDVARRRIPVQSVLYRAIADQKIAYIRVTVFGDKTTAELDAALKQAQADGARGIILDLRNNGGGWVQSAQEMIGRFVAAEKGPALYEELDPNGTERTPQPILAGDLKAYDIPLIVLVNQGTASASEIVAGALRDYGRATIVGEKTFGKGSVQRVHDFNDGSSARITFAEWLTPGQHRIQGEGIVPDVVLANDQSTGRADAQFDKAIELITGVAPPVASPVSPALPIATPAATPSA
jgi:carboxyl-terminal processing protease